VHVNFGVKLGMEYGLGVRGKLAALFCGPYLAGPISDPSGPKPVSFYYPLSFFFPLIIKRLRENSNRIPKSFAGDSTLTLDRKSAAKEEWKPKGTSKANFSFLPFLPHPVGSVPARADSKPVAKIVAG